MNPHPTLPSNPPQSLQNTAISFNLARILIAIAWADGSISPSEKTQLNQLLKRLPSLPQHLTDALEMYYASPIDHDEIGQLLTELKNSIKEENEKFFVLYALTEIAENNPQNISEGKKAIIQRIEKEITNCHTLNSAIDTVRHILSQVIQIQNNHHPDTSRIVDSMTLQLFAEDGSIEKALNIHLTADDVARITLTGFLMTKLARCDNKISPEEIERILNIFENDWQLDASITYFFTRIILSNIADHLKITSTCLLLNRYITPSQKKQLVDSLYGIAMADGNIDATELAIIQHIAQCLNAEHRTPHKSVESE